MDEEATLPAQDTLRVHIFVLADHAASSTDQKLYINGAGVHGLIMPNLPGSIMTPLSLVIRVHVPYLDATDPHHVRVRILDEDQQPIGPDPIADIQNVELGRAPGTRPGDENAINMVLGLTGFPVQRSVERELRTRVYLEFDGRVLDSIPLKLLRAPTGTQPG